MWAEYVNRLANTLAVSTLEKLLKDYNRSILWLKLATPHYQKAVNAGLSLRQDIKNIEATFHARSTY